MADLGAMIGDWSHALPAQLVLQLLTEADIRNSQAYTASDIAADPQYRARRMVQNLFDLEFGRSILPSGAVPRVDDSPLVVRSTGPAIGAHNDEILRSLLELNDDDIAEVRDSGRSEHGNGCPPTLYDKVCHPHTVAPVGGGEWLLNVDRHLLYAVTSPQAFEALRAAGCAVRRPDLSLTSLHIELSLTGADSTPLRRRSVY